jgi:hypothetical protein
MSKMKAVVLEKSGSCYTVLGENGTFRQVKRRFNAEVGEEIEISTGIQGFGRLGVWVGVAALFILVFTTILRWNPYQPPTAVALLSVDINPSLQFTLDSQGHLLNLQIQNEDAKRMLSQIDLTGKPIDEVLGIIVTQAYNQKFLNSEKHWVVVGYSPLTDKDSEKMHMKLNESQIITWITETVEKKGFTPQVAVFPLTSQERELAQKGDLTLGEYALLQTAQKAGIVTQPEKLKDTSERVRLLENPQVQAQIQSEKKGLEFGPRDKSGTAKQDSGTTENSNKDGTGKSKSDGLASSPIVVPNNSEMEKGKGENKEKDTGQAYTKDPDKAKNSSNKEKVRIKKHDDVNNSVLGPIPTPGNSKNDTVHTDNIPEHGRENNDHSD